MLVEGKTRSVILVGIVFVSNCVVLFIDHLVQTLLHGAGCITLQRVEPLLMECRYNDHDAMARQIR